MCPIIQLDHNNLVRRVFFSPKSGGYAPPLDTDKLQNFYEAKRKLVALFESDENVVRHKLRPGQIVMFGNSRILHARTYFNPVGVSRHLEGLYIDHDTVTKSMWNYRQQANQENHSEKSEQPTWTKLTECTVEDVQTMGKLYSEDAARNQANRALNLLRSQKGEHLKLGAPIDLYTHGLQTATRAHDAGEPEDLIVAALLHDVGELMSATNHGDIAAALLAPYVEPAITWMLAHHEIFQMYYYGDQAGIDKNKRELFKDSPHYELTEAFCRKYDQVAFDPNFECKPIEFFVPMVHKVFSRKPYWHTPNHPKSGAVLIPTE